MTEQDETNDYDEAERIAMRLTEGEARARRETPEDPEPRGR